MQRGESGNPFGADGADNQLDPRGYVVNLDRDTLYSSWFDLADTGETYAGYVAAYAFLQAFVPAAELVQKATYLLCAQHPCCVKHDTRLPWFRRS